MNSGSRAKLRTKTGCLTCRQRRKKCDEKFPVCGYCERSGRECPWPTSAELVDRRFASHEHSRHAAAAHEGSAGRTFSNSNALSIIEKKKGAIDKAQLVRFARLCALPASELRLITEAKAAHGVISRDMEIAISRHFIDTYYGLLLLPNGHPQFYHGWILEIQDLMTRHKSLYYSLLANAASHIHFIDASSQMQELALTYYSNSLKDLSRLLTTASTQLENHNGILMSVMLLYLHGCMGRGTYTDIPRHVNAATRILTMRLLSGQIRIERTFDRLAVESLLYQIFLVTTGLWSDPIGLDYEFNSEFWTKAEELLQRSTFFPNQPTSVNSPVLGIPVSLFRLTLSLKQQFQNREGRDPEIIDQLRREVELWEPAVLGARSHGEGESFFSDELRNHQQGFYRDSAFLFIIIASLLKEQLVLDEPNPNGLPLPMPTRTWQVKKAIQILEARRGDDLWASCFMGNWPIYTMGFFMSSPEHIDLIRAELQRRWDLIKFSQLTRFRHDLERAWAARERVPVNTVTTVVTNLRSSLPYQSKEGAP